MSVVTESVSLTCVYDLLTGCTCCHCVSRIYIIYDLVPKGVHENRTKGVENKVDDTLKLVVFLECAQC